jgi:hypothetical protein
MQDHIERYCTLIVYSSFLSVASSQGGTKGRPFQSFTAELPEIQSALERLVYAFPLLTLELDAKSSEEKLTNLAVCHCAVSYGGRGANARARRRCADSTN